MHIIVMILAVATLTEAQIDVEVDRMVRMRHPKAADAIEVRLKRNGVSNEQIVDSLKRLRYKHKDAKEGSLDYNVRVHAIYHLAHFASDEEVEELIKIAENEDAYMGGIAIGQYFKRHNGDEKALVQADKFLNNPNVSPEIKNSIWYRVDELVREGKGDDVRRMNDFKKRHGR